MTVKVEGLDKTIRKLNSLGDPAIMKRAMHRSVQHIHVKIAKYPGPRAGSGYRRTGTLGRQWTTKVEQGGKVGKVGNTTPYAQWVQSAERQTWFHEETGWKTDEDIAESEAGEVKAIFEDEYSKAIG